MSTTSIKNSFVVTESTKDYREDGSDGGAANQEPPLLEILSLTGWRKLVLETLAFLAVITLLQHLFPGNGEIPGLPHPYWLPVLLASCQYGVTGGAIATVAASVVYFFELSPPTASQDFYTYAGIVTVQPAAWLATALVLGGLRNLHIHQSRELADQLAASRGRANDLSNGLERAAVEINALERRIAIDMGSVAALSRAFSQLNMSDRRSAALSYGELFHVGTGTPTFIVYLRVADRYVPVWAVEDDTVCFHQLDGGAFVGYNRCHAGRERCARRWRRRARRTPRRSRAAFARRVRTAGGDRLRPAPVAGREANSVSAPTSWVAPSRSSCPHARIHHRGRAYEASHRARRYRAAIRRSSRYRLARAADRFPCWTDELATGICRCAAWLASGLVTRASWRGDSTWRLCRDPLLRLLRFDGFSSLAPERFCVG